MKKKKIKLLKIYLLIIILSILSFFLFLGLFKYYFIYSDAKSKFKSIEKEIKKEELNSKKIKDATEKSKFSNEIEKKIIDKYMVKRPGERVIELVE